MSKLRKKKKWLALGMIAVLVIGFVVVGLKRGGGELQKMMKADVVYTYYQTGPAAAAFASGNGDLLQIAADGSKLVYIAPSGEQAVIYLDETGRPIRMVESSGRTFIYANYTDTTVDVAMVSASGKVTSKRKVPIEQPAGAFQDDNRTSVAFEAVLQMSEQGVAKDAEEFGHMLAMGMSRQAGRLSADEARHRASIATGLAVGVATYFVAGAPVAAVVGVGAYALLNSVASDDALPVSSFEFDNFTRGVVPLDPFNLVQERPLAESIFNRSIEDSDDLVEGRVTEIHLGQSSLIHGSGDVQATLTWNNRSDVDLWVVDPNGERIYFRNKRSRSGGRLDVDDRNGHGPENIFWPRGRSPKGRYRVFVHHYARRGPADYKVLITVNGSQRTFEGMLDRKGQRADVWDFNTNDPEFATQSNEYNIEDLDPTVLKRDADMAMLSEAAYGKMEMPEGWKKVKTSSPRSDGYSATLYKSTNQKPTMWVLAFRGTEPSDLGDIGADVANYFDVVTRQYQQAVADALKLQEKYGENLKLTGHSLGGGLAIVGGLATGLETVTFNPAAPGEKVVHWVGNLQDVCLMPNIRNYVHQNDPVDAVNQCADSKGQCFNSSDIYMREKAMLKALVRVLGNTANIGTRILVDGAEEDAHSIKTIRRGVESAAEENQKYVEELQGVYRRI